MAEPIAIVGMACRFGGAPSLAAYWDLLASGRDGTSDYPGGHSAAMDRFYAAAGTELGPPSARAGFLEHIDRFDAEFFGISPREAELMDPQQRVLLELAWDAMQDAGETPERLAGRRTGVFVGVWTSGYERVIASHVAVGHLFGTSGNALYGATGRLGQAFDIQGPELSINAACSSSLAAVHQARASLLSGECDMAVVAGANIVLRTDVTQGMARAGVLASDGVCRFGSIDADGFARSEGAAVVILKRLSRAIDDDDRIYAVVRGSAISTSGSSSGSLTRPSENAQSAVVAQAIATAGLVPSDIDYVEAHGTATYAGDRVEFTGLSSVFGSDPQRAAPLRVGSSKTNIGHTESAAGLGSMIKAALALQHRYLPASLHVTQPNPDIDWVGGSVVLQTRGEAWEKTIGPRRAGVSAFGITGSNAHAVLEEAPPHRQRHSEARDAQILPLSARSDAALRATATAFAERLDGAADVAGVCFTAARRRAALRHRVAIAGSDAAELAEQLRAFAARVDAQDDAARPISGDGPQLVMVFPGQGSQWHGMGRRLYEVEPVFRASLDATSAAVEAETGWSVTELLLRGDESMRLGIERIQPTLFAIEVALAQLWTSYGLAPAVCLGHSMGEVAAAHIAGVLSLEDAVAVICRRSALMTRFNGQGAMALVELSLDEAQRAIAGHEHRLSIAVSNAPRSTVLSGDPAALERVLDALKANDVFCRPVAVDVAAHSPQMDLIAGELVEALRDIAPRAAHTPIYSTTLGRFADGPEFDAAYWAANLRRPVLFHPALDALLDAGFATFVEASPHPILLPPIEETARTKSVAALTVSSLRRDEPEQREMLSGVACLFEHGFAVDWRGVYRDGEIVDLPGYAWQRGRFWVDGAGPELSASALGTHPLLGSAFGSADGEWIWTSLPATDALPWLKDHAVRGSNLLPASAYVEIADAVAGELHPDRACVIEELTIKEAIVLSARPALQILVSPKSPGRESIKYFMREDGEPNWTLAASGVIVQRDVDTAPDADPAAFERAAQAPTRTGAQHADALAELGYDFGPAFRVIDWYAIDGPELRGAAQLAADANVAGYGMHPALLDAAFQSLAALLIDARGESDQLLPFRIERARFAARAAETTAVLFSATITDVQTLRGDVRVFAPDGTLLVQVDGLSFSAVRHDAARATDALLFLPEWTLQAREHAPGSGRRRWLVIAGADSTATAFAAALEQSGFSAQLIRESDAAAIPSMICSLAAAEPPAQPLGIVDFRALDLTADVASIARHGASVAALASALDDRATGSRLWLVTRGACGLADDRDIHVEQASVWGLGAVIANERPGVTCSLVDLGVETDPSEPVALVAELTADGPESRMVLRGEGRFVERVVAAPPDLFAGAGTTRRLRDGEKFDLHIPNSGLLESAVLDVAVRRPPLADEVEIEVDAAGLNFLDVIRAMGLFDPDPHGSPALGTECAGTIVRVGSNVTRFAPGDAVVALSPAFQRVGAMTSHLVTSETLVAPKPRELTFAQAGALPCVYLTCYYALVEIARMRKGETLLVHSATGGVGLSAIEVSRWLGLEVFATAGTEEKRAFLRALGVKHVMDSRAPGFAEAILAATGGRGVDAILNSLSGSAIPEGLTALAPYGRFLEIGKRDMWDDSRIGMGAFLQNRSFSGIDLATLVEDRPELVGEMLRTVMTLIDEGVLAPLPITVYAAANAADAFHQMAQAKHIGKIVIDTRPGEVLVRDDGPKVHADGTYLITGGVGALGLIAARALVDDGARHLVLCARRDPSPAALEAIAALQRDGAQVVVRQVDLAAEHAVDALLREIRATMPPLRGVVHSAGILSDALLDQLTPQHFADVMAGKVEGALLLDRLTRDDELDLFVMFSSIASLLGTPGQANYAAANAMLDALAERRAAGGRAALSIAWGPWADVGLAAAQANRGARISEQGLASIAPDDGLTLFRRVIAGAVPRVAAMHFDVARWCETVAAGDRGRTFDKLSRSSTQTRTLVSGLSALRAATPEHAPAELRRLVVDQLASVLRLQPEQIAGTKAFRALGLDSLMGLELRNRLERALELKLSASVIWNYPTVDQLCAYLAGQLGIAGVDAAKNGSGATATAGGAVGDLDSELAEAEALLASL